MLVKSTIDSSDKFTNSWLGKSSILWVFNLTAQPIVVKLGTILVDWIYSRILLVDVYALVYFFEMLRSKLAKKVERKIVPLDSGDFKNMVILFSWLRVHRDSCVLAHCGCKKSQRWAGLLGLAELKHLTSSSTDQLNRNLLFLVSKILHDRISKNSRNTDESQSESQELVILWLNFCLRAISPEFTSLHLISGIIRSVASKTDSEKELLAKGKLTSRHNAKYETVEATAGSLLAKNQPKISASAVPFDLKLVLSILKDRISMLDGEHRKLGVSEYWTSTKLEERVQIKTSLEVSQVVDFFNDSLACEDLIQSLFHNKVEILRLFETQGDTHRLSDLSQKQQNLRLEVEQIFAKLHISNTSNYYKSSMMRIFYLLHLKEDIMEGRKALSLLRKFRLSSNLTSMIDTGASFKIKTNGIILTVSGEYETAHSILNASMNISSLGFSYSRIIGADLKCVIPNALSKLHQTLFSKHTAGIRPLMLRPALQLHVQNAEGDLIPATITYRVNLALSGLQYVGLMLCKDCEQKDQLSQLMTTQEKQLELYMITKLDGEILDSCGLSKWLFRKGANPAETSPALTKFFKDFFNCQNTTTFQAAWEGKIKAVEGLSQFKLIE